jgi:hypothetical protein
MKLSTRKELLKESELTLKSIKKSLNEAAVPQSKVEKVTQWMKDAIRLVVDKDQQKKYDNSVEAFFRYLEIQQGASLIDGKKYADSARDSFYELEMIISKVIQQNKILKKMETEIPEIRNIMRAVEKDLKTKI